MSYVSVDGRAANMAAEIPGWNVDPRYAARPRGLAQASAQGRRRRRDRRGLTTFYTSCTTRCSRPSVFNDVDGRYIGFDDKIHTVPGGHTQYATFSDWDTYRSLAPLQTMLFPKQARDMANSLVRDAQQQGGWWPKWPSRTYRHRDERRQRRTADREVRRLRRQGVDIPTDCPSW